MLLPNFSTFEATFKNHTLYHRRHAESQASSLAYKHFKEHHHNFQQLVKFTSIEKIKKQTSFEETGILLKRRINFWVLKLKALYPHGLNQVLNNID